MDVIEKFPEVKGEFTTRKCEFVRKKRIPRRGKGVV
jgi:hypothetical protein